MTGPPSDLWATTAPAAPCGSAERSVRASGVGVLSWTQAFVDRAGGEHIGIAVATADQLHADRQPVDVPGGDGGGRMAGEVDDIGEAPTDERVDVDALDVPRADRVAVLGVVDGQRREGRGDQEVVGAQHLLDTVVDTGAHPLIAEHVEG